MRSADALAALQRGEPEGLEVLVAAHHLRALKIAFGITRDYQAAEDIVAEAFVAVYRHAGELDSSQPVGPWITRVVVNASISVVRRKGRENLARRALFWTNDPALDPAEVAAQNDTRQRILHEIGQLPARDRAVLISHYFHDCDVETMAASLGLPTGTVKSRLARARKRLRTRLMAQSFIEVPVIQRGDL
ncbi:MAG: RNA polymerase sigma factor [Candidatus Dormibacteria bacterium]